MRRVVRNHRWIQTMRVSNIEYEHVKGMGWIPLKPSYHLERHERMESTLDDHGQI